MWQGKALEQKGQFAGAGREVVPREYLSLSSEETRLTLFSGKMQTQRETLYTVLDGSEYFPIIISL